MGAHQLVFFVGQGQGRGHGDRIAGVHAHRIDVFDCADDNGVIRLVADHLHLEFFPAQQALVDKDLRHRGRFHAGAAEMLVLFAVIGHATAGAAKGKGRADNRGQADIFDGFYRQLKTRLDVEFAVVFLGGGDDGGLGVFNAQPVHRLAEQFAIFCHFNGFTLGANHLDAVFFQHAHVGECKGCVEASLPAHCGQQGIGALFFDNLGHNFGCDRLDICRIRQPRIGHDRRRVGVDQNDAVTFFAQCLAGLCARVVKFAGLPNNNRARTDNHDRFDIITFWHGWPLSEYVQIVLRYRHGGDGCKRGFRFFDEKPTPPAGIFILRRNETR